MQIALLFIAGFVVYIGYLVFQPGPNIRTELPIELDKTVVSTGEPISLKPSYCSEEDIIQRIDVQVIVPQKGNSAYTAYTVDEADVRKGCHKDSVTIDTNRFTAFALPSGEYKLRLRVVTKLNPINTNIVKLDSVPFYYNK